MSRVLVMTHVRKERGVCRISMNNLRICYETRIVFVNTSYDTKKKLFELHFHILFCVK